MTVEEQNYIASVIEDSLNSIMQWPLSLYKAALKDSIPFSRRDGINIWRIERNGPAGTISVNDTNLDGLLDINNISVSAGTPAYVDVILQEGASGRFGPWPVWSETYWGKTVFSENGNPGYITILDKWLLRMVENYEPLQPLDEILGGVQNPYMKNVKAIQEMQEKIKNIEKITDERQRKFQYKNAVKRFMAEVGNSL